MSLLVFLKNTLLFFIILIIPFCVNSATNENAPDNRSNNNEYKLGAGDIVKIKVFNQEDLSGEYTINGSGNISLPLINLIAAKDLSVKQLEQAICDKLKPDYLLNPRVSVQVLNYRPYYIMGEIKGPNSYPYVDGMTYRNAIIIAGGFTYRAKEDHVLVIRGNDNDPNHEVELNIDERVQPGDIIRVEERYF